MPAAARPRARRRGTPARAAGRSAANGTLRNYRAGGCATARARTRPSRRRARPDGRRSAPNRASRRASAGGAADTRNRTFAHTSSPAPGPPSSLMQPAGSCKDLGNWLQQCRHAVATQQLHTMPLEQHCVAPTSKTGMLHNVAPIVLFGARCVRTWNNRTQTKKATPCCKEFLWCGKEPL